MNISLEKKGNVAAVITIKMEQADYEEKVKSTLKDYGKKVQMPGFRPGHVPAGMVKKMYGTQVKADTVNHLLGEKLFAYIEENKLNVLGEPLANEGQQPQDIEKQNDFEFVFDVALAPEFTVELSADDKVDYYDITVSDSQIDEQVKSYCSRHGHHEDVDTYADRDLLRGILTELDENGQPKEGGIVEENVSLMPTYFKNDDQKKIFEGAKKNDVIVFNPTTAYGDNNVELAGLMHIEHSDVANHSGNFSYQVDTISRYVTSEINQELFDAVFGKDTVKSEEEFRGKIKEDLAAQNALQSDGRFFSDVRTYVENKVGTLEFADDILKRFLETKNEGKGENYVEENYDKSITELKWQLIHEKLAEANNVKVTDADVRKVAIDMARFRLAQYGIMGPEVPEEYYEQCADQLLKDKNQVHQLVEYAVNAQLLKALKGLVTLNHKAITPEEFAKLGQEVAADEK
jgi:trigger factor